MKARTALLVFCVVAVLGGSFFFCPSALATKENAPGKAAVDLTSQERAWLLKNPSLTVITDNDMAPYGFVDDQGRYVGIMPDIAARLEELLGLHIKFRPMPYADLVDHVRKGTAEAAALFDIFDAPYEQHYLMTDEVLFMPYALFVRKDSDLAAHPPDIITGKTIALIRGWDLNNPSLDSLRGNRFVFGDSYFDALTLVLRGRADAFFDVQPATNYLLAKNFIRELTVIKVYHEGYPAAFFVRRQWPELHSALQKALAAITRQERMELLKKWNAFMDDAAFRLAVLDLGPGERMWLKDHPVVRVGMDAHRAPLEFVDADGHKKGIAIDYLLAIEKLLGIRFEIVSGRGRAEYRDMAARGEIDMLSCAAETPGRSGRLIFTKPYLMLPVVILTRTSVPYIAGLRELTGSAVAVVKDSAVAEWMAKDYPGIELVAAATTEDLFGLLEKGHVRACVESLPTAGYYLGRPGHGDIKVSGQTPYVYGLSMAVRSDYPVLAGIVQKALDGLPDSQRAEAQQKWMAVTHEKITDYGLLWKVLLPVLVALAVFAYWTRRLFREVSSRKLAEAGLREAQKNLEQLNQDLEARVCQRTAELEQTAHTLRESQERFRAIAEHSPDAIVITDLKGIMRYCNSAAEKMFGYGPGEMTGQSHSIILPPRFREAEARKRQSYIGAEGLSSLCTPVQAAIAQRKDGTEFFMEFPFFAWKADDEIFFTAIIRDITERKKAEDEVRQARDFLENVFKASPDAIIVTDSYGYIIMANESVESVYGYRPEELVGEHVSLFATDDDEMMRKTFAMMEELYEKGIVRNFTAERRHKAGHAIQIESSIVQMKDADGKPLGGISISRDITDRKRLEEQLRQSQKMEAIGTLAGGVAHDFNNILGVIFGYAELSKDLAETGSPIDQNLSQILTAAERAKALVQQILAFSRKAESTAKPLHMHAAIAEALKLLRASLPSTISMRLDIDEADDMVVAGPTELQQIIMNLCTNAADAMQPGGGVLEILLKPVELDEHAAGYYSGIAPGPYVQLSIKDTGSGIAPDIIGRIFEPFFTTKEVGKGTGMGLAMVHGIVKSFKGDIKVYSEQGRGTVVHIVLPRVQAVAAEGPEAERQAPKGRESVLLVDDEEVLLDVGKRMLNSLGYRVTAIGGAREALDLFRRNPAAFDIVITDQTMPQLTGYELARQLIEIRPDIPVILCTGYSDLVTAESALAGGIRAFVLKPLNRLSIAETLREALGNRAQ